jgi:hypothetical protein
MGPLHTVVVDKNYSTCMVLHKKSMPDCRSQINLDHAMQAVEYRPLTFSLDVSAQC